MYSLPTPIRARPDSYDRAAMFVIKTRERKITLTQHTHPATTIKSMSETEKQTRLWHKTILIHSSLIFVASPSCSRNPGPLAPSPVAAKPIMTHHCFCASLHTIRVITQSRSRGRGCVWWNGDRGRGVRVCVTFQVTPVRPIIDKMKPGRSG